MPRRALVKGTLAGGTLGVPVAFVAQDVFASRIPNSDLIALSAAIGAMVGLQDDPSYAQAALTGAIMGAPYAIYQARNGYAQWKDRIDPVLDWVMARENYGSKLLTLMSASVGATVGAAVGVATKAVVDISDAPELPERTKTSKKN